MKITRTAVVVAASLGLLTPASSAFAAIGAPVPVTAGGGALATAPNAPAAPTSAKSAPAGAVLRTAAGVGPAVTNATIVCTPNVQNPHNSSHVNGTINVVVTLTCTSVVPQINIRAALYKNGLLVKDSGQRTFNNTAFAQNNAAVPCSNGTYQGWMSYGVLFPPGFTPPTGASSGFGNAVSIVC
jgi:hypothetical protein